MSIIAYPLEATEYTAEDVQSYLSTRTSGVFSDEITLTPEGMTATISPFLAWFNYAKFKGCSVAVTQPEYLTFSPAHAVLDRIDRVVLRLDFTVNKAYFKIIEGTALSYEPTLPEISRTEAAYDISPFYVKIKAGATQITSADITSTILDESVCGIMRDGVTGIPTAQLQAQVEELIERLNTSISEVEGGSAFMISSVYDPENKAKPVAFDDEILPKIYPVGSIITTRGATPVQGLPGTWEMISPKQHITFRKRLSTPEANTVYTEVFDVSDYYITRDSHAIIAMPKTVSPEQVSVSSGSITTEKLASGVEVVKTFEVKVSNAAGGEAVVHVDFSGISALGFDYNYDTNASGVAVTHWERVE